MMRLEKVLLAVQSLVVMVNALKHIRFMFRKTSLLLLACYLMIFDILNFLLLSGALLAGFSLAFQLIFGLEMERYRSFRGSVVGVVRIIFGYVTFE